MFSVGEKVAAPGEMGVYGYSPPLVSADSGV